MKSKSNVSDKQMQISTQFFVNLLGQLGVDFDRIGIQKTTELVEQTAATWLKFVDLAMEKTALEPTKLAWQEFKKSGYNSNVIADRPDVEIALEVYTKKFIENLI